LSLSAIFTPECWRRIPAFNDLKRKPKEDIMKKFLLALMVLACAASVASAAVGVAIQWQTGWGVYDNTASDLEGLDDYLLDSYSMTWQLIYSVDDTADAPDLLNGANGWVSGDDEVWATRTLAQSIGGANVVASDGTEWYNYIGYVSGANLQYNDIAWTTAGYIYQRIYQGAVQAGTWYYDSEPEALVINPTTWQDSYVDEAGLPSAGIQPNQQVVAPIPEPATMGLLGLGALVMAIRRRRA
jgi:hypothetical protein